MNITFLIGNGFDLNLGLKTAYGHFLKHYLSHTDGDNPKVTYFKEKINRNWENWADVELALGQCTKDYTDAEVFMECYDDLFDKLAEYLSNEEKKLEKYDQEIFGEAMQHAMTNWREGFRVQRSTVIESHIKRITGEFVYNFIVFNYTYTLDRAVQALNGKSLGYRRINNTQHPNLLGQRIHVHGYTDKDMILGLNDISQIANAKLFNDCDVFDAGRLIKPEANLMMENNTDRLTHALLEKSDLLYIYGMSLGDTDRIWWERIGKVMEKKPDLQVIIYCYDAPNDALHYHKFRRHENRIRAKLCDYFDASNLAFGDRIHVTGMNIFSKMKNIVAEQVENLEDVDATNTLSM